MLAGRFRLCVQGEEAILEAGDCLEVPRDALHSAEVVGTVPVISLDATRE